MLRILDSDYMDMSLGFAYRFLDNSTVLTEMHDHNYYEYFIITSGTIIHTANDRDWEQNAGEMVFIRPHDRHKYRLENGKNCNIINISFTHRYFE
ncbi:MAG: AraC family ligand binding domain-containing protein, partial [Clostridia bacterium]|nr:AraC family ligand binding domain-containing protein [Clostridia bacterium]